MGNPIYSHRQFSLQGTIFTGLFLYKAALMMIIILIPMRMVDLGFKASQIGLVTALPALLQVVTLPLGGWFCDRFGQRKTLLFSYLLIGISGLGFVVSRSMEALITLQVGMGFSRGIFWPATQSSASFIDTARMTKILGRHVSISAAGDVVGFLVAGYLALFAGFNLAFGAVAVVAAVSCFFGLFTPEGINRSPSNRSLGTTAATILRLMVGSRPILFCFICAFIAATPLAFASSFFPVYFGSLGFNPGTVGFLIAVIKLGTTAVGLVFEKVYSRVGSFWVFLSGFFIMGATLVLIQPVGNLLPMILVMFSSGIALGLLQVLQLIVTSSHSSPEERGSAMAVAAVGGVSSNFIIPLVFGFTAGTIGLGISFTLLGWFYIVLTLLARLFFRWVGLGTGVQQRNTIPV